MKICVFCASSETIEKSYLQSGEQFGKMLAEHGDTLVFGAGKYGVMGAVARGIRRKGGSAVGVIPTFFNEVDVTFTDCELIYTDTMRERKQIMEDLSDAFVMMPGGIGTFEEFFEILTLKQLRRHTKPIVIYNVNGYYNPLFRLIDEAIEKNFMADKCRELYFVTDSAEKVFEHLDSYRPILYNKYDFLEKEEE
ncbi:MAG: TIGR00730 family Rossman fold protein [Ruminococcus sp.]|nr:TIGR00730 family Rossman fold protein [Ruminococcus sp.]